MTRIVEAVVAKVEEWKGKSISIQPLPGGLTNANFRVDVNGDSYFVRVPGVGTELLAINRENEFFNTSAAAQVGVGPKVVYYFSEEQVMILEYLSAKTMSKEALNRPGMPASIAMAIRRLHSSSRFLSDFNMFRLTDYYLKTCLERSIRVPDGYAEGMPLVLGIEKLFLAHPLPTVPCNNDLLAENYMDDGKDLRIIDYKHSGNNDPTFELGNTCQEFE